MKKILSLLCMIVMILQMVSCEKQIGDIQNTESLTNDTIDISETVTTTNHTTENSKQEDPMITSPVTYKLNDSTPGVKVLGERCLSSDAQLNCDWTGSGLEMDVYHTGGNITFVASATANCYFRAYVDGVEWKNVTDSVYFLVMKGRTRVILKDVPAGEHRIKLIKVTGYTIARAQILDVTFAGTIKETAPADKNLYIEFVGDSICCGWGTIGNKKGEYTDQDGTLAYPLMVAEALTKGYLYESALRTTANQYDFARKADIVVINIGTNDYAYRTKYNIDEAAFQAAYLSLLRTVAEKNGEDCIIYCLYNTMNDTFSNALLSACAEFGGEAKNVYTVKMTRATKGASGHPSIEENEAYTEFLINLLKKD